MLESGRVVEIFFETRDDKSLVGNIYKGRVSNVATGMQAAFIAVGLGHDVFVPFTAMADVSSEGGPIIPPVSAGEEVLVQIIKEPVGNKGARGSTNLTLPGRYVVLMPNQDHIGVSRKISSEDERERLRAEVEKLKPEGMGLIVRTVAEGKDPESFREDVGYLRSLWDSIQERAGRSSPQSLIYRDSSLLHKIMRDTMSSRISEFLIDSPEEYASIKEIAHFLPAELAERIRLYEGPEPLFHASRIDRDIERALDRQVWLKSGGYVVIEQTEALCSIDVNTGRFLGKESLEETAFFTNMEAATVIARQVRLRNLAGIIIIDFIDMSQPEHRESVVEKLRAEFATDRAKTQIFDITELGLVQMSRQRLRTTLESTLKEPCPTCRGQGRNASHSSIGFRILDEILDKARTQDSKTARVTGSTSLIEHLQAHQARSFTELSEMYGIKVELQTDERREGTDWSLS